MLPAVSMGKNSQVANLEPVRSHWSESLLLKVTVVAIAALSFLAVGLAGFAIGVFTGAALWMITDMISKSVGARAVGATPSIEIFPLEEVGRDPFIDPSKILVGFWESSPFAYEYQPVGSIEEKAEAIRAYMQESESVRLCERLDMRANIKYIRRLPPEISLFSNLRILDLSENRLEEICPEIGSLHNLESLLVSENHLQSLPSALKNLVTLRELKLDGNHFKNVPPEIASLENLETLDFSDNQLKDVPKELFALAKLRTLLLNRNDISDIPSEVAQSPALEELELGSNNLQRFPAAPIANVKAPLRSLDLVDNQLGAVPESLALFLNLEQIVCWNNPGISDWVDPKGIIRDMQEKQRNNNEETPQYFDLEDDPLKIVPASLEVHTVSLVDSSKILVDFWESLPFAHECQPIGSIQEKAEAIRAHMQESESVRTREELFLRESNKIKHVGHLPPEISLFSNLKVLDLSANRLQEICPEIGSLHNLELLVLSKNHLQSLPSELKNLVRLKELRLDGNHFKNVPPEIASLEDLGTLDFADNQLKDVPKELFALPQLQFLFLNRNDISDIPSEVAQSPALQRLELQCNCLQRFLATPVEALKVTSPLQVLYLDDNQLEAVPKELAFFQSLDLYYVSWSGNPALEEQRRQPGEAIQAIREAIQQARARF